MAAGMQPGVPKEPPSHVLRQINFRFALYRESTVTKQQCPMLNFQDIIFCHVYKH